MSVFNQSRKTVIQLIFLAIVGAIIIRLFFLQVLQKKYKQLANEQAIERKVVYPSRGIIYDCKGRAVVTNDALYDLMVTPASVKSMDTAYFCNLVGIDTAQFRRLIYRAILKNSRFRSSVFIPLLSPEDYGRLQENLYQFPGFELVERPVRNYPYPAGASIFGYIGEVDSATIRRSKDFYLSGDFVGKNGLERSYESVLMGTRGIQYLVRDVRNRPQGPYAGGIYDTPSVAGRNLYLALDMDLQTLGERLMQNKIGAIVALDPKTGGVLALVSSPDFNPNLLRGADRSSNYARLLHDPEEPLFNRATQAGYPPGSTFKPVDALIALNEGVITPAFGMVCLGAYYGCGRVYKCTETKPGHASSLLNAIAYSCNSYFLQVFRMIVDQDHHVEDGLVNWDLHLGQFGLGHRLGIDLPGESPGYIPDTTHYDKVFGRGRWNSCTVVSVGIGQGETVETPLQIANLMAIIANHGYYYTPHLVMRVQGGDKALSSFQVRHEIPQVGESDYQTVIKGMEEVVEHGTAFDAQIPGIDICGKTGTSENYKVINGVRVKLQDHSLFGAFAPMENPKIAICVVVENAGFGATWAAPIASLMMEKYLNDSIATDRLPLLQRLEGADLIPDYIKVEKLKVDSLEKASLRRLAVGSRERMGVASNFPR
ncbi:MAG TPA: penicillin-binding protein 2 [Chitinophagaceae bacterium]|nr:penicillin-binding protein 2 [Chitinophagaceae bacterium]